MHIVNIIVPEMDFGGIALICSFYCLIYQIKEFCICDLLVIGHHYQNNKNHFHTIV